MHSNHKLILAITFLFLVPSITAFHVSTFQDGTSTGNMTFNGTNNVTKYLVIPVGVTMTEAQLKLQAHTAVEEEFVIGAGENVTTYSGIWTVISGGAITNPETANDENWTNYAERPGSGSAYFRINFTTGNQFDFMNITFKTYTTTGNSGSQTVHCYNSSNPTSWISIWSKSIGGINPARNFTELVPEDCFNNHLGRVEFRLGFGSNTADRLHDVQISGNMTNYSRNISVISNLTVLINGSTVYNNPTFQDNVTIDLLSGSFFQAYINTATPVPLTFLLNTTADLEYSDLDVHFNNSLTIIIRDETTGELITDNITVLISNSTTEDQAWTTTGTLYLTGAFDGDYTIVGHGTGYPHRYYFVTFTGSINIQKTIYLSQNATEEIAFTTKNKLTGDNLEGVLITMERVVNGTFVEVASRLTDIQGIAILSYIPNTRYRFTASIDGYQTKTWIHDPIQSPEYTVLLLPTGGGVGDSDYWGVIFDINPKLFLNNTLNNISIRITSENSILTNYTINISYPGGSNQSIGTNPAGETINYNFTILNALITDTLTVRISYTNTLGYTRTYQYDYMIEPGGAGTMFGLRSDYGMGLLDRILISIFLGFVVGGAASMIGGMDTGLWIALFVQAVTGWLMAISIIFLIPSIIAAIFLVAKRSS